MHDTNSEMQEKTVVVFSTRYIDNKDNYLFAESDYFEDATAKLLELDHFKKMADEKCKVYWQQIYRGSIEEGEYLTYSEICERLQIENAELKDKIIDCLLSFYIERRINKAKPKIGDSCEKDPKFFFEIAKSYRDTDEDKYFEIKKACVEAYKQDAWSSQRVLVQANLNENTGLMNLLLTEAVDLQTIGMYKLRTDEHVYAIHALPKALEHDRDWIRTLYSIATEECVAGSKEQCVNVILVLHDKDVKDSHFHRDFYVASKEEVNQLYGEEVNTDLSEPLRIAFYMHTSNPIVEILTRPLGKRNIVGEVRDAVDKNIKIQKCLKSISTAYAKEPIKDMVEEFESELKKLDDLNPKKSS